MPTIPRNRTFANCNHGLRIYRPTVGLAHFQQVWALIVPSLMSRATYVYLITLSALGLGLWGVLRWAWDLPHLMIYQGLTILGRELPGQ